MEKVMQYLWQWRLYGSPDKRLTDGRPVRIIHPGLLNTASGPDFFNAKILLDGTEWAGNVELHLCASDWHRHGHDRDEAYDSVILHVVGENDGYVRRRNGDLIPQLHLPFGKEQVERFSFLCSSASPLRCRSYIAGVPKLFIHDAIDSAAMERLQAKAARLDEALALTGGDWAHVCLIAVARALGGSLNADPFEQLARTLPPYIARRHSNSHFQLEALLLGYAGLLEVMADRDDYARSLFNEWEFLKHKYSLLSMPAHLWKFSGSRPVLSPLRKLVYFAHLHADVSTLFSRIIEASGSEQRLERTLLMSFDGYWASRLAFGPEGSRNYSRAIGKTQLSLLIINAVAPLIYAYGSHSGRVPLMERAVELWQAQPAEDNRIIKTWSKTAGVEPSSAWESQGLLQIFRSYCEKGDCLRCRIALQALKR